MKLSFVTLLVAVVLFGLGFGGAFAGGVAMGQRKGEATPTPSSSFQSLLEQFQQGTPLAGMGQRLRQGTPVAEGMPWPEGTPVPGMFGFEGALGGTRTGVVEKVEGNAITLASGVGSIKVNVDKSATVSRPVEGQLSDIEQGDTVLVVGRRNDDGTISATTIMIMPVTP